MKLRNKLILSCAALAAVATTAVSTTYAWYTANTEVTADGISGLTESNGDALLLISSTGNANTWGSKVTVGINNVKFVPVAYNEGTPASGDTPAVPASYTKWDATANAATGGAATANTDYIQFPLYFKSGNSTDLKVTVKSITLTNAQAASLPTKSKLTSTGLTTTDASSTYSVDLIRALNFVTEVETGLTEGDADATTAVAITSPTRTAYDLSYKITSTDTIASATAYNAHEYYNAVKSLNPGIDATKLNSETVTPLAADAGLFGNGYQTGSGEGANATILGVLFTIYLDGWDKACFDAVQGQTVSLSMTFETRTTPAQNNG